MAEIFDPKPNIIKGFEIDERILKIATIDTIHNILHQVFSLAMDDNYKLCGNHPDSDLERLDLPCKTEFE